MSAALHQSQLRPHANKFHVGNGADQKHYWLTPPELYSALDAAMDACLVLLRNRAAKILAARN